MDGLERPLWEGLNQFNQSKQENLQEIIIAHTLRHRAPFSDAYCACTGGEGGAAASQRALYVGENWPWGHEKENKFSISESPHRVVSLTMIILG